MDREVFDNCLEVLRHYRSDSDSPEQCLGDLISRSPELKYLPDYYLRKVYWPEFMGDQIGFQVQEGYLLYRYSIGEFQKYVATKSLTSTVVKHLEKVYANYTGAYNSIPALVEEMGKRNGNK